MSARKCAFRQWILALAVLLTGNAYGTGGDTSVDGFIARSFTTAAGDVLPYRLFVPAGYRRSARYPLVVYLHGGAGRGSDNQSQIGGGNRAGTRVWTSVRVQERHPSFVLAPQIPLSALWIDAGSPALSVHAARTVALIESLKGEFSIDSERIYVTGQSLGGAGAWDIASKRPALFAAAVPLCGAADIRLAASLRGVPIWVFHGALDKSVPVENSRAIVAALRDAGGAVRYTEYPDSGHDIWTRVYAEPELVEWVMAQRRHPK